KVLRADLITDPHPYEFFLLPIPIDNRGSAFKHEIGHAGQCQIQLCRFPWAALPVTFAASRRVASWPPRPRESCWVISSAALHLRRSEAPGVASLRAVPVREPPYTREPAAKEAQTSRRFPIGGTPAWRRAEPPLEQPIMRRHVPRHDQRNCPFPSE